MSNTKERIIDVSIKLFAEKGYTETTLKEIGQGSGIQAASIYNHFKSKNEILEQILQEYSDYISESVMDSETVSRMAETADPKELLMSMFLRYSAGKAERFSNILKIILHEHLRNELIGEFYATHFISENVARLDGLLVKLIECGRIAHINHLYYAKILNSIVISMSLEHYSAKKSSGSGEALLMDELLGFMIDIILRDEGMKQGDAERNYEKWLKTSEDIRD